jgi:hypothetical protein
MSEAEGTRVGGIFGVIKWIVDGKDEVEKSIDGVGRKADESGKKASGAFAGLESVWGGIVKGAGSAVSALSQIGLAANGLRVLKDIFSGIAGGVVDANAEFERYQTQMSVLLGSTEAAKQRLNELTEFAQKTPFELPGIIQAEKIMMSFGLTAENTQERFGKSANEIRTILGDVAAGAGADFESIADYMGRFASGATGQTIMRFTQMGIVTKETMQQMGIEFSKAGEMTTPVREATTKLLAHLEEKYGGMMAAQSQTFEGMMSNLSDWWWNQKRLLAEPIFDAAKAGLGSLLEMLNGPEVQQASIAFSGTLSLITEGLMGLVSQGARHVTDFKNGFIGGLQDTAMEALGWGFNIIAQLAEGIMDGLGGVLTTAMNAVGDMLAWFLAPGSPPRVAPEIDQWGVQAMGEFLRGMTEADFSVLESMQGPLRSVLDLVTENAAESNAEYQRLNELMMKGITDGGFTPETLEAMREAAGEYGDQLVALAQAQAKLKEPMDALTKAQEALTAAQDKAGEARDTYDDENDKLRALKDARSGLKKWDPKALTLDKEIAAQEEVVKAAKAKLEAEQKNVSEAQKVVTAAQARVREIQKEVTLQNKVLQQMMAQGQAAKRQQQALEQMNKAAATMGKTLSGVGKGLKKDLTEGLAPLTALTKGGGLVGKLDDALGNAVTGFKENLRKTLLGEEMFDGDNISQGMYGGLVQPLRESFAEIERSWDRVRDAWNDLKTTAGEVWDQVVPQSVRDRLREIADNAVSVKDEFGAAFAQNLGLVGGAFGLVALAIWAGVAAFGALKAAVLTNPLFAAIAAIVVVVALLKTAWDTDFGGIRTTLTKFWEGTAKPIFEQLWLWITETLIPTLQEWWDKAVEVFTAVQETVRVFWEDEVKPRLDALYKWLIKLKDYLERQFKQAWETAHTAMTTVSNWISGTLNRVIEGIRDRIQAFKDRVEDLRAKFAEFMQSPFVVTLRSWITEMSEAFDKFAEKVWGIYNAIMMVIDAWGRAKKGGVGDAAGQSVSGPPPGVFAVGSLPTLNAAAANAAATAALGDSMQNTTHNVTLQVLFTGDVSVNGSEELADEFMAKTQQALADRLGRLVQPLRDQYKLAAARGLTG